MIWKLLAGCCVLVLGACWYDMNIKQSVSTDASTDVNICESYTGKYEAEPKVVKNNCGQNVPILPALFFIDIVPGSPLLKCGRHILELGDGATIINGEWCDAWLDRVLLTYSEGYRGAIYWEVMCMEEYNCRAEYAIPFKLVSAHEETPL